VSRDSTGEISPAPTGISPVKTPAPPNAVAIKIRVERMISEAFFFMVAFGSPLWESRTPFTSLQKRKERREARKSDLPPSSSDQWIVEPPLIETDTDCCTLLMFPLFWEALVIPLTAAKAELKLFRWLDADLLL